MKAKDRKRLDEIVSAIPKAKVRVVGPGRFVQRSRKPQKTGKRVKSVMMRVDAQFAALCRKRAETEGSVTEVTRQLFHVLNGGGK